MSVDAKLDKLDLPQVETSFLGSLDHISNNREDLVQKINRRFALDFRNPLKNYIHGEIGIVTRVRDVSSMLEYDCLIFAIIGEVIRLHVNDLSVLGHHFCCDQKAVFIGVTEGVKCPKSVIPSLIWLERAKDRKNFGWNIKASLLARNFISFNASITERELSELGVDLPEEDRGGIGALIERSSQIVTNVSRDTLKDFGWMLSPSDLMHFRTISVDFNGVNPWLRVEKDFQTRFEIVEVMLTSQEAALGTIKGVMLGNEHPKNPKISSEEFSGKRVTLRKAKLDDREN